MNQPDPMESASDACAGQYSPALLSAIDAALQLSREERPQTIPELRAMIEGAQPAASPEAAAKTAPEGAHGYPVGPDGAPLPPVQPAAPERSGRTFRIDESDRVLAPEEAPPAHPDTLALHAPEGSGSRRFRSPRTLALSAVLLVALAGIGYAAWRFNEAGDPNAAATPATADTGADTSADTTAATSLAKANRSLAAAKSALRTGDFKQADQAAAAALRQARAVLGIEPDSQEAKVLVAEIAGFTQALASARDQHVAALLNNASKAIDNKQWAEAESLIADAENAGAPTAETARVRARLTEARNAGGRIKEPPKENAPVAELSAAERLIGQGWEALRKGDLGGSVGSLRNAWGQIAAVRTRDVPKARIDAAAAKAGELNRAITLELNKRITKLRQEADSAMQSGDVDGGKRRLEAADRMNKMRASLKGAAGRRAEREPAAE